MSALDRDFRVLGLWGVECTGVCLPVPRAGVYMMCRAVPSGQGSQPAVGPCLSPIPCLRL